MVTPTAKRLIADYFMQTYKMKERKACRLINVAVSSKRYRARGKACDQLIKKQLISLAATHIRYGYRRLTACLHQTGAQVNHKKVYRLYKEAHLKYAQKKRQKIKYVQCSKISLATKMNEVWGLDFVSDTLTDKRTFRCFNVIDICSRFSIAIEPGVSLPSLAIINILDQAIHQYGKPQSLIVDNGPEFRSQIFRDWAQKHQIRLHFIEPGKPTQNAYIESFNGKFRDECLNQHWFSSMQEAKSVIAQWREHYNHSRPHSALKYLPPIAFINQNQKNTENNCQNQKLILK